MPGQSPVQGRSAVLSPGLISTVTALAFACFYYLVSLKEDWPGVLEEVPSLGLSGVFLKVRLGLWVLGRTSLR